MKKPAAIRCEKLDKAYGPVPAVRQVDLMVMPGRFVALLGPSGCGKTTVLRLIAGFEKPDQGTIQLDGQTVASHTDWVPPESRRCGMVFQEYALFPHLTVGANIAFGLAKNGDRTEHVRAILRLIGLEGFHDRMPHELSGGQQQRVALGRALAPNPAVILLDEPFSNLDAGLRDRVRQEIRRILREAGVTALFVTHDQEEALSLADEVAVMMDGRIEQCDRPERLYRCPASHRVATFLGDANFLPGTAGGKTVECVLGPLALHAPQQGPVELMFRPEDLLLEACADGPAEIIDRVYFGHDQLLRLRYKDHTLLQARQIGCCRGLHPGTRVRVRVDTPVMAYPAPHGCPLE